MVVLAVGVHRLVARHRLAGVHAAHQPQLVEQLQCAIDACYADALATRAQAVGDLLRGDAAAELVEHAHHRRARSALAVARSFERALRVSNPLAHACGKDRLAVMADVYRTPDERFEGSAGL